jgi:hypothetical protein
VVFDLLARGRADLRPLPYAQRRRELEELLGRCLPPGLVLTRATDDAAVARGWLLGHGASGTAPRQLILGRFRPRPAVHRRTQHAAAPGRDTELDNSPRPATTHLWPRLPPHQFGSAPTAYSRVVPELVVELSADLAVDGSRWRHPVRFVRVRGELTAGDLAAAPRPATKGSATGTRRWGRCNRRVSRRRRPASMATELVADRICPG